MPVAAPLLDQANASKAAIPETEATGPALRRNSRYRRSLAAADVAAAGFALLVASLVSSTVVLRPTLLLAAPLVVLVSKVIGLYDRDADLLHQSTLDEVPALFHVATLYALLTWLADDLLLGSQINGSQVIVVWALLTVSMLLFRSSARHALRRFSQLERCIVVGDAASSETIGDKLSDTDGTNATVVGRIALTAEDHSETGRLPFYGDLSMLPLVLADKDVERVIIAPPHTSSNDTVLTTIRLVKALGVRVSVLPRLFEAVGSSVRFDEVEGLTLLGVPSYGLTKSSAALKRGMDLAGSTVGFLALLPTMAVLASLVKLTSRGPLLFRQVRIGRHGQEFEMLKFRSMVQDADRLKAGLAELNEADRLFKIEDDPRVTYVGKFLRRFSLDELPQLFNVLKGDMSLVGPRPLVPEEDRQVGGDEQRGGWERRRLEVKPGMTGIWQVLGSTRIPFDEMVKIDYLYGANWSLWLDCKILLRTVRYMVVRRGI